MQIRKIASAAIFTTAAALSSGAQAVDITYCDNAGNPYCDGVSFSIVGGTTVAGTQNGCHVGGMAGPIVYSVNTGSTGIGAAMGFAPDADYAGTAASSELSFGNPPRWRLIDLNGGIINEGLICVGAPASLNASSATSAAGD